jgi:hypothetical protein
MKAERFLAACLLSVVLPAYADGPALDKSFLEYLEQFGDERGEVFDPRDLDSLPTSPPPPEPGPDPVPREIKRHD